MAYDKAKWHFTDDFPSDLNEEQIYVHTGFYLGWIVEQGLFSEDFEKLNRNDIEKFSAREITAPKLFENQGGVLSDDELNEQGRLFTNYYYENYYFNDYRKHLVEGGLLKKSLPSDYHVKDSWDNYEKIIKQIKERFNSWQNLSDEDKLKYKKTFDFSKYGINENSRAINEYFVEKYSDFFTNEGFKYLKSKELFSRNRKETKELFGVRVQFRGGCGFTIFPYFGIMNKEIEKIYNGYTQGIEYLNDKNPEIIYSDHKITQDNDKWANDWSPQDDESKVDEILERVIHFYNTEGQSFYSDCGSIEKISELLLKHQPKKIEHPYLPIRVFERIIKGLIASNLNNDNSIDSLIEEFKPFFYEHYSKGDWAYDDNAKELFDRVANDILNKKNE